MCGNQKTMSYFRTGMLRQIERLFFKVLIGYGSHEVASTHWLLVFFNRPSNRRCFSSH